MPVIWQCTSIEQTDSYVEDGASKLSPPPPWPRMATDAGPPWGPLDLSWGRQLNVYRAALQRRRRGIGSYLT
eukprot:7624337-Pyramimonas_sp.AAC.1